MWPKWLVPEVVNANAEVGDPWEGRRKQEGRNTRKETPSKTQRRKDRQENKAKKETECGVGQGPLDKEQVR